MTALVSAQQIGDRLPLPGERTAAKQLRSILAAQATRGGEQKLTLLRESGNTAEVVLTPGLSSLLMRLLEHVGRGDAVTLVPVGQMLTTQQAADILNVSRPFLISLLDKGEIPHVLVGRHRRIEAAELLDYKQHRDSERATALSSLAEADADLI